MASLTAVKEVIKKLALPLLFVLISVTLISLIIFQYTNTKKQKEKEVRKSVPSPKIQEANVGELSLQYDFSSMETPSLPQKAYIYKVQKRTIDQDKAIELAKILGITSPPSRIQDESFDGRQFIFSQDQKKLIISQSLLRYEDYDQSVTGTVRDQAYLEDKTKSMLILLGLINTQNLKLDTSETRFFSPAGERKESAGSLNEATLMQNSYNLFLDDLPIYGQTTLSVFSKTTIRKDAVITLLRTRFFDDFVKDREVELISKEDAQEKIKNGEGKVVKTALPDEFGNALELDRADPKDFKSVNIKRLEAAYFLSDTENELAQPIYIFSGEFTTAKNEKGIAEIYLPAY